MWWFSTFREYPICFHQHIGAKKAEFGPKVSKKQTIQATISELKILKPKIIETTAYGAGLASAIGNNLIKVDDIQLFWKKDKVIEGIEENTSFYKKKHNEWKETIKTLFKV